MVNEHGHQANAAPTADLGLPSGGELPNRHRLISSSGRSVTLQMQLTGVSLPTRQMQLLKDLRNMVRDRDSDHEDYAVADQAAGRLSDSETSYGSVEHALAES